ncbi:MAG: SusD/RagB family nutrient-binding outer membrane lipoprotein [Gemmatimonadales bacterium]
MKRSMSRVAIVSLAMSLGAAGCGNFLTGDSVINDPNHPSNATLQQSFLAVQAGLFGMQESTLPLTVCMWMQQCTGIGGRFVDQYGKYTVTDASWSADFTAIYSGGGLVDIRRVEDGARAANDRKWLGIAQVYEAFLIGTAADLWGDIPYREAVNVAISTPALDPQMQVYADVQAMLDSALVNLASGMGTGPLAADLVYGGDAAQWTEAANTLKARFYMHTAEVNGAPDYAAAITAATAGISSPANDFRAYHGSGTGEGNIWVQFAATTFGQDVVAGKRLVDIMVARSDPRLAQYFDTNSTGGYGGQDINTPVNNSLVSKLGGTRHNALFRQPLVTYGENELILAEAYNRGTPANDALALTHLNNERATVPLPNVVAVAGAALLDSIMTEKYVALFQNIETYNDYRRTCLPALQPFPSTEFSNKVPGRLFYGLAEENANPNIPPPSTQLATNGFRNPNDPVACP